MKRKLAGLIAALALGSRGGLREEGSHPDHDRDHDELFGADAGDDSGDGGDDAAGADAHGRALTTSA